LILIFLLGQPDLPEEATAPDPVANNDDEQRTRAIDEIFLSEDTYLKNLQRIIWVRFILFLFLFFGLEN
jgi:hypothetical protein